MTQENKNNAFITEDYVSFEVAKLLKEKGFDEYSRYFYTLKDEGCEGYKSNRILGEFAHNSHPDFKDRAVSCPTLQMVRKWHLIEMIIGISFMVIVFIILIMGVIKEEVLRD